VSRDMDRFRAFFGGVRGIKIEGEGTVRLEIE